MCIRDRNNSIKTNSIVLRLVLSVISTEIIYTLNTLSAINLTRFINAKYWIAFTVETCNRPNKSQKIHEEHIFTIQSIRNVTVHLKYAYSMY